MDAFTQTTIFHGLLAELFHYQKNFEVSATIWVMDWKYNLWINYDKKYIKTKERKRLLADESHELAESSGNISTFIVICLLQQCLKDMSQVGVALFP